MNEQRPAWLEQARDLLEAGSEGLDAPTLSRLNRARQAAIARRRKPLHSAWPWAAGVAAAAACAVALLSLGPRAPYAPTAVLAQAQPPVSPAAPASPAPVLASAESDAELLGADDAADLVQDLDFYAWLDAQGAQDG